MWTRSSLEIHGVPVELSLQMLEPAERQRAAVLIAWFTEAAEAEGNAEAWRLFTETVLDRISFTVSEDRLPTLSGAWWSEAAGRATAEFIRVNELGRSLSLRLEMQHDASRL